MKTQVKITELTKEDLVDLFSTAFYGSNYLSVGYEAENDEKDGYCEGTMANVLLNGKSIRVTDRYADGCHYGELPCQLNEEYDAVYTLGLEDIIAGLERSANGTFNTRKDVSANFADKNEVFAKRSFEAFAWNGRDWDAITADCLMQIILFDEIVYG